MIPGREPPRSDDPGGEVQDVLNAALWYDGILWAVREPEMREQFKAETDIDLDSRQAPIDHLVDEATGKTSADLTAFVDWFTERYWGSEWDPRP